MRDLHAISCSTAAAADEEAREKEIMKTLSLDSRKETEHKRRQFFAYKYRQLETACCSIKSILIIIILNIN